MSPRYRPTAADLDVLEAGWAAYLSDDDGSDELLAEGVRRVLGWAKTRERLALERSRPVSIEDLPQGDRSFGVDPS